MTLDVSVSDPPSLDPAVDPDDYEDVAMGEANYRREDLEAFLEDGAWERAFAEWTEHTDLTEEEYAVVDDMDLIEEFDFFWDDFADRVGYHAPGIPEDWQRRDLHPELDSWETVSAINAAMTELGQVVSEVLKSEYVDWDAEYDAPEDLPDYE